MTKTQKGYGFQNVWWTKQKEKLKQKLKKTEEAGNAVSFPFRVSKVVCFITIPIRQAHRLWSIMMRPHWRVAARHWMLPLLHPAAFITFLYQ